MVTLDLVSIDRESRERQKERNMFALRITYSICKMVFTGVVFALLVSMILNSSQPDNKILSIAIVLLLVYEFVRMMGRTTW